jgi:hypothetical protein
MKLNSKNDGRFYHGCEKSVCTLLRTWGTIQGKDISIATFLEDKENYINVDLANQLLIPKPSIIEKINILMRNNMK